MKANNSLRQFIKDGLAGIATMISVFVLLFSPMLLNFYGDPFDLIADLFFFPKHSESGVFVSPMPFVILTAFVSVGIGGKFLEKIGSRKGWLKPVLIISVTSFLIGSGLFTMFYVAQAIIYSWDGLSISDFVFTFVNVVSGIGAVMGFIIAGLAGVIINPNKRNYRILIGSIASTLVGCCVGFGILFPQMTQ
jgi:hypothetical protein